ncbi:MAG: hypothetical protein M1834_003763 [Cirrosporium novae-zelandiae]|nr:MAG: hypothetical protein M1834_003763 [Cirrosporium novae-zelandiae]
MSTEAPPKQQLPEGVKITLHWLNQSRAQRILWLLEDLNVPYEVKVYHRSKLTMLAPAELKHVHPLGKSPLLTIEAPNLDKPLVLAESAAIVEYLVDHFGKGTNIEPNRWREGLEGKVGDMQTSGPFLIKPVTHLITSKIHSLYLDPNLNTHFSFMESQLESAPDCGGYLCGNKLNAADIMNVYCLDFATYDRVGAPLTREKYPKLYEYTKKCMEGEGAKRAVRKIIEVEGSYDAKL